MGICWDSQKVITNKKKPLTRIDSDSVIPQNTNLKEKNNTKTQENNNITNLETSFEKSLKDFPDMPEWENGIKKGYGIKQMNAYKCNLIIDELNKKRDDFWNSKNKQKNKWKILHQACIYDHINAEEFLYKNGFNTVDGCINMCIDKEGNIFRIPNYCINDPYYELELLPAKEGEVKNIDIKLVDSTQKKLKLNVSDNITGQELIDMYVKYKNIDLNNNNVKLFFGGGIIKNGETLFQHNVKNGYSLQVCVLPKS